VYRAEGRPDRAADELARLRARAGDDAWSLSIARAARRSEAELRAEWAGRLIGMGRAPDARAELARVEALVAAEGSTEQAPPAELLYALGSLYHQADDAAKGRAYLERYLDSGATGPAAELARRLVRESPPAAGR
jgi:hypothetical protein